jgi:soluble lytic murein transglycosylase
MAQVRRRRWGLGVGAAVLIGVLIGALISSGVFDRALREITLPLRHDDIIRQQAAEKHVDAGLIAAVIYAESRFHDQTSHAGARGLMQVTPATAQDIERRSGGTTFKVSDLSDPQINISYGTFYLRELLDRYEGNEVAALAAYNAGPGMADEWGGSDMSLLDVPTAETRGYVAEVLDKQRDYRDKYARELGY